MARGEIRSQWKQHSDRRSKGLGPGSWVRFSPTLVDYADKLARIAAWDDDGFNRVRAPRNKHVIVYVEPHIYGETKPFHGKLQYFYPVSDMEVIAEHARAG